MIIIVLSCRSWFLAIRQSFSKQTLHRLFLDLVFFIEVEFFEDRPGRLTIKRGSIFNGDLTLFNDLVS